MIVSAGAVAGEGSDADVTDQLISTFFTTLNLPKDLLDEMIKESSAGNVGAIKAMDGAADPNATKTAADLPTGVDEDLARCVVAVVIEYCDKFADLSFTRKFLGLPANDAEPEVRMGSTSRNSGLFGLDALPYTLAVVQGLVAALQSLDDGTGVLCNPDGTVILPVLYAIMHVAPLISPEIAQLFVESDCVQNSVCFFLEAWLNFIRECAAGTVAATTAVKQRSWLRTAYKAAANLLDFDWIDARLWELLELAERLGVGAEMAVRLRLTCTLFKRLPPQHWQLEAFVPLRLISELGLLPTRVIANTLAGDTLSFLKAALTHVANRHRDTTALASIGRLTIDDASSIVVEALRNGGLYRSLTASLDVCHRGVSVAVVTPHRDNQLGLLGFPHTGVSPRQSLQFALARPLEPGSFAFPTKEGCSGYVQSARFDVFDAVLQQLDLEPELSAAAMAERRERARKAAGTHKHTHTRHVHTHCTHTQPRPR